MGIFHQYVSAIADGGDTDVVQPSNWNAVHTGINEHTHTTSDDGGFISMMEVLTGDRTYYVSTDGSDTNTGLTTDSTFATIQHGLDTAARVNFNGYNVTIQIADGSYVETLYVPVCVGQKYINSLKIIGNPTNPENVVLTNDSNYFSGYEGVINVDGAGAKCYVAGMQLETDWDIYGGLSATMGGQMQFEKIVFTDLIYYHIQTYSSGYIECVGDYTITGGYSLHFYASTGGKIETSFYFTTVTISSTDVLFDAFAWAELGALISSSGATYSTKNLSCQTYYVKSNAIIYAWGLGASYFPGTVAGETATGGIYG